MPIRGIVDGSGTVTSVATPDSVQKNPFQPSGVTMLPLISPFEFIVP